MVTSTMNTIKLSEERAWDPDKGEGDCEETAISDGVVGFISYHN